MTPLKNYSLKPHNTFGFDIVADAFVKTHNTSETIEAITWAHDHHLPLFPIGGGSNLVLTQSPPALVLQQCANDIRVVTERDETITLYADAGVNWHTLVRYCVEHEYYGLENLSLIPGSVGAAPMQNIGAYGVELADVLTSVHVLEIDTLKSSLIKNADCRFAYRDSIFKNDAKGQYLITGITIELNKKKSFNLAYAALNNATKSVPADQLSIEFVSNTVCDIRNSKLPQPEDIGNAGSFFKNPSVSLSLLEEIHKHWPEIPSHPQANGTFKLPAAWMVEKSGWKGHQYQGVGVHRLQSIVLVNYGHGSGLEILELAKLVQKDVLEKFGVQLEIEPIVV